MLAFSPAMLNALAALDAEEIRKQFQPKIVLN